MASEATQILREVSSGDRSRIDRLMEIVYDQLRRLARARLGDDARARTLEPTAIVHEVFVRLVDYQEIDWRGKSHFFAVSAQVMRNVLVDYARERAAQKRGGGRQRIPLADDLALSPERDEDVLAVDEAITALGQIDAERARMVELRFFGGLSVSETAEALGIAERTVGKRWAVTRRWLRRYLEERCA